MYVIFLTSKILSYAAGLVRDSRWMGFLLCGWVAAALWFRCFPNWNGKCGTGWRLPASVWGPTFVCLFVCLFVCSLIFIVFWYLATHKYTRYNQSKSNLNHCLAPVFFQIYQYSLILLPGIRSETYIKFFFVIVLS